MKLGTNSANYVKIAEGIRPCWAFIFHIFDQISVKISVLVVLYPYCWTDGVKFGTEEGTLDPLLLAKFPHRSKVSLLRGEKPQNRPLSTVN